MGGFKKFSIATGFDQIRPPRLIYQIHRLAFRVLGVLSERLKPDIIAVAVK